MNPATNVKLAISAGDCAPGKFYAYRCAGENPWLVNLITPYMPTDNGYRWVFEIVNAPDRRDQEGRVVWLMRDDFLRTLSDMEIIAWSAR